MANIYWIVLPSHLGNLVLVAGYVLTAIPKEQFIPIRKTSESKGYHPTAE